MGYRKDIDGLRGVAVLLVVFHHAGFTLFQGGFVGVDVFFVISGYLITGLILAELKDGGFSFLNFYSRRLKRLMPAYITVLLFLSVLALFLFLPGELLQYSESMLYSFAFISNYFFANETGGYFAVNSNQLPLLHTWSLSVEEQFYVLWPFIMVAGFSRFRENFGLLVILGLLMLFVLSEVNANKDPINAYFLLLNRGFELLMGGVLALYWSVLPNVNTKAKHLLSVIGGGLIVVSSVFLNKNGSFPGINAFYPCIGTVLLIYSGKLEGGVINRFLSFKWVVFVGLISYPLYLWHWPILSFMELRMIEKSIFNIFLAISISLILSFLTWAYIEKPVRTTINFSARNSFIWLLGTPLSLIVLFWMIINLTNGMPSRIDPVLLEMNAIINSKPNVVRRSCNNGEATEFGLESACVLGFKKSNVDVLLVGDSHANALTGFFDKVLEEAGLRGYDVTRDGTPYLLGATLIKERVRAEVDAGFEKRNLAISKKISSENYKYVILAARWDGYLLGDAGNVVDYYLVDESSEKHAADNSLRVFKKSLKKSVQNIIQAGSIPVLVKSVPVMKSAKYMCDFNNIRFSRYDNCSVLRSEVEANQKVVSDFFDEMQSMHPHIIVVDPKLIMCDTAQCRTSINNVPLYRDNNHLNDDASKYLGGLYIKRIGNPLL